VVDRLVKIDSGLNRVLETRDDQGGQGRQQPEDEDDKKKKKDKFDKGKPFWKRLIPEAEGQSAKSVRARLAAGEKPNPLQLRQDALLGRPSDEEVTDEEEQSVTLSRKILVLWGVVDMDGRPRLQVIITYTVVALVIAVSTILIFGILFRRA
jgi:hypothetical protein